MNESQGAPTDKINNSTGAASGRILRAIMRTLVSLLPPNAPVFIYTKILTPPLLRALGNMLLKRMIPSELIIPEGTLCLNQKDPVVSGALALGAYEPYFTKVLREALARNMVMVDIGANLGYYTLIGSAHAARVIAFEPETENANLLLRTVARNNITNVTLMQKGLGEKSEILSLSLHPDNKGKHSLLTSNEQGVTTTSISLTTLDSALEELHVAHVDLIKMDIEGWEAKALRGAAHTISTSHPIIMFEFAPARIAKAGDDPKQMLDDLLKGGYKLFVIDEEVATLVPVDAHRLLTTLTGWDDYVNVFARPQPRT